MNRLTWFSIVGSILATACAAGCGADDGTSAPEDAGSSAPDARALDGGAANGAEAATDVSAEPSGDGGQASPEAEGGAEGATEAGNVTLALDGGGEQETREAGADATGAADAAAAADGAAERGSDAGAVEAADTGVEAEADASDGSTEAELHLEIAPGDTSGTSEVYVTLVDAADTVSSIAVSVLPDGVSATAGSASVTLAGLGQKSSHTFTVAIATSLGRSYTLTTNPLVFYDVVETFHEPECDHETVFTGAFTFDTVLSTVSKLGGALTQAMTDPLTRVALTHQLASQGATTGTVNGLLVATFALPTTVTFSGGGWAPGGYKTYGNHNAYALIFVDLDDPAAALGADAIDLLAYADCTDQGLMGAACMTGTTIAGYGSVGSMEGYPTSQVITLR